MLAVAAVSLKPPLPFSPHCECALVLVLKCGGRERDSQAWTGREAKKGAGPVQGKDREMG